MLEVRRLVTALRESTSLFIILGQAALFAAFDISMFNDMYIIVALTSLAILHDVSRVYMRCQVVTVKMVNGFDSYQSRPILRLAYKVRDSDTVMALDKASTSEIEIGGTVYEFKHYEPVKVGDYIVFLNDTDVYHCDEKVFLERNVA